MKLAVLSALALASLVPFTSAPADLAFGVAQDATLQKRFVGEFALELNDVWVTLNDEDMSPEMFDMEQEGRYAGTATLVVSDRYALIEDGNVLELLRTYESIERESESSGAFADDEDPSDDEREALDEVEGRTLRFARESAGDAWTCEPSDDGEEIDADLNELAADLDHLELLPVEEVSVGDEWGIELRELGSLLEPGVDLVAQIEGDEDVSEMPEEIASQLRELFEENEITCTYAGNADVDGVSLARIELAGEFAAEIDLSSVAGDLLGGDEDAEDGPTPELSSCTLEVALEIEGALLWNLDAGRFEHFEFVAEASGEARLEAVIAVPEHDMEFAMNMGASVTLRFTRADHVE